MGEAETKKPPLSPQPSTSRAQLHPITPEKSPPPNLAKRMRDSTCFTCFQKGHWSAFCPQKSKSPNSKSLFPASPARDDSPNPIRCRCGHGFCEIRISRSVDNPNRKYFTCPIKMDRGPCSYRVSENELLNGGSGSSVPIRRRTQRTLHDYFEGGKNERTNNDLVLGEGDLLAHTKRMRVMENSETSERVGFPEFELTNDDLEFANSVSWDTLEADALSRIQRPQEIDKSMENSLTMEEHNKLFEEEKVRFAQLQDDYDKTKASLEASNCHKLLLHEEVSNLKVMLHEKQEQLKSCELETMKLETHLCDLKKSLVEAEITLKKRGEQREVAKQLCEETQIKEIVAKALITKN